MANVLIIDGNTVYEIDEECVRLSEKEQTEKESKEKQSRNGR